MKTLFTFLLTIMISLSLMGQQDIKELKDLKEQRYSQKRQHGIIALEKKKSKNPDYASSHLSRQASSIRSAALKTATATNQKLDSILWELYDAHNTNWVISDRELFTYDDKGNMTTYVWFAYDSDEMKILPLEKETVKHNAQGQATEIIWLAWDKASGQWLNQGKFELTYDESGNLIQEIVSEWDPASSAWFVVAQFEMTYDAEGRLLTELWSYWDEDSATLVLFFKDEYLYEDGKLVTWNEYDMEEGEWVLYFKTTYTYDGDGNLTDEMTRLLEPNSGTWLDFGQFIYSYNDADQLIMEEEWAFDWDQFMMVQFWQYDYVWDSDGNLIGQVDKSWDGGVSKGTNAWMNEFKSEFSFNKDYTVLDLYVPYWFTQNQDDINFVHMPVSELGYVYVNEDWAFDYRQTAYYSDFGGATGTEDMREPVVSIFPVPASGTITFTWDDAYNSLSLEVYDLTGKRVISRNIDNNETISVDQFSGGIYLYKLTSNNSLVHSGKISIE